MSDITVVFAGAPSPPDTIQNFFPPIAPEIDIFVDPKPTPAEQQTVLNLVAALTHRYRPAAPHFTLHALTRDQKTPTVSPDPFRRSVVVREVGDPRIELIPGFPVPYINITGEGERLEEQSNLFRENLIEFAQTDRTKVESFTSRPVSPPQVSTFGQIGAAGTAAALGQGKISLDLSPVLFSESQPASVNIRLIADHTPVQENEKGTLTVAYGNTALGVYELDNSGHLDTRLTIPSELAVRSTDLALSVNYQPAPGMCNARTEPMLFQVSPESTITLNRTDSGAMGGFDSLPRGFASSFQVASDNSDPEALHHAVQVVSLLQYASKAELHPVLVDLETAARDGSGAVIIAQAESVNRLGLNPPVTTTGQISDIEARNQALVNFPGGLASIQAFAHINRTVLLITTSGDWALLKPLFVYLADLKNGWADLKGDVLFAGAAGKPETLSIRASSPHSSPIPHRSNRLLWPALITAMVVVICSALTLYLVRRHNTRNSAGDNRST
ncbi:hypothetical protein HNP40_000080 [Mycobacteroides chelonae]|nr:hypothetical protein [Mycobacteroides chelonae]